MREVETQPVGRDERARLVHALAEHLAQRRVQQVRRRVIALRVAPPLARHARHDAAEVERRPAIVPIAADGRRSCARRPRRRASPSPTISP